MGQGVGFRGEFHSSRKFTARSKYENEGWNSSFGVAYYNGLDVFLQALFCGSEQQSKRFVGIAHPVLEKMTVISEHRRHSYDIYDCIILGKTTVTWKLQLTNLIAARKTGRIIRDRDQSITQQTRKPNNGTNPNARGK